MEKSKRSSKETNFVVICAILSYSDPNNHPTTGTPPYLNREMSSIFSTKDISSPSESSYSSYAESNYRYAIENTNKLKAADPEEEKDDDDQDSRDVVPETEDPNKAKEEV